MIGLPLLCTFVRVGPVLRTLVLLVPLLWASGLALVALPPRMLEVFIWCFLMWLWSATFSDRDESSGIA